jgi:1,2-diacylglycerol 3-alpha-glucosyltransferase
MKITVASSGLGHVSRGIEAWAADLGHALHERGVAVSLCKGAGPARAEYEYVLPCWRRTDRRTLSLLRWLPRRVGWRVGLGSPYAIEQTTFALRLLAYLRREAVDVLHVQDPLIASLAQKARRCGLIGTRTILAHGTEEPLSFQRNITYLQHLTPWHLEQARAHGVWMRTWTAIPNFIDTDTFSPGRAEALRCELGIPADALIVLTAAAIKRNHKRIDYLLNEFTSLPAQAASSRPVFLVIAGGKEPETDGLVSMGKELLGGRVRFLIDYPRARMPELYRLADVFVLSSLSEMMPIALVEATASGLPCLVHGHPVLEWIVGNGGRAVDMGASGCLAAALGEILGNSESRRGLGMEARSHCLSHFARDSVVEQILDYYRFVLRDGTAPAATPESVREACEPCA